MNPELVNLDTLDLTDWDVMIDRDDTLERSSWHAWVNRIGDETGGCHSNYGLTFAQAVWFVASTVRAMEGHPRITKP